MKNKSNGHMSFHNDLQYHRYEEATYVDDCRNLHPSFRNVNNQTCIL